MNLPQNFSNCNPKINKKSHKIVKKTAKIWQKITNTK